MVFIQEIKKIPLFRLIIPFILGIIIQLKGEFNISFLPVFILTFLLFTYILTLSAFFKTHLLREWVFGTLISITLMLCGMEIINFHNTKNSLPPALHRQDCTSLSLRRQDSGSFLYLSILGVDTQN